MKTGTSRYFGWGLVGLFFFALFSAIILRVMRELNPQTVAWDRVTFWMIVFALGIALSVWLQFSVAAYFHLTGAFETTYFDPGLSLLERNLWPPVMILSAAVAISTVMLPNPMLHLAAVVCYLAGVAGWDLAIWKLAKPKRRGGNSFKIRCGQLFRRIDGPALGIVMFWLIIILVGQWIEDDGWRFATLHDLRRTWPKSAPTYENAIQGLEGHVHMLCEPLLAGVIGFHMLLTVVLLWIHLIEWEARRAKVST